jgi:DNA polymerase-3 subunit delta'
VSADENYLNTFQEMVSKLFLNLNEIENVEKNNMRIEKRIHPDVKVFGEDKNIDVKTVSSIVEASSVAPFEADKKIFVLMNTQNMNEASQNKILKTIEEPPKNTYFILACKNTTRILQTIISRVKQIELDELSAGDISNLLVKNGVEPAKAEIYASCASGNGTFAEKLATDDGFVGFFNNVVSAFFEINGSRDVLKFSNDFSAKNIDKNEFFDIAMVVARDVMMILSGKEEFVLCKNIIPKLKVISSMLNLEFASKLIDACVESKKKLLFNVNSTAVIDDFLFKIAEVKVKCRRL